MSRWEARTKGEEVREVEAAVDDNVVMTITVCSSISFVDTWADDEEKGYCLRGANCQYEHDADVIIPTPEMMFQNMFMPQGGPPNGQNGGRGGRGGR